MIAGQSWAASLVSFGTQHDVLLSCTSCNSVWCSVLNCCKWVHRYQHLTWADLINVLDNLDNLIYLFVLNGDDIIVSITFLKFSCFSFISTSSHNFVINLSCWICWIWMAYILYNLLKTYMLMCPIAIRLTVWQRKVLQQIYSVNLFPVVVCFCLAYKTVLMKILLVFVKLFEVVCLKIFLKGCSLT